MNKLVKTYKKLHKWPGLIISILLMYYSITGIFMNHRAFFSRVDVPRTILPTDFQYHNWNNGALKGNVIINSDSIWVFGNIGVWQTDSTFKQYSSVNAGFPKGMDNRKVFDVHRSEDGCLYAATQFGLFAYNKELAQWQPFQLNVDITKFVAVESIGDTVYAINRSYLFKGKSEGCDTKFDKIELKAPSIYQNELSLFETIWQMHSGEILGLPGKLFVDILGLITLFLSLTGIVYFIFPSWIKQRKQNNKGVQSIVKYNRWSLKWHNFIGAWTFVCLIILFFTGMFLRPPLLIAIANLKVKPIKYTHLDQPNPWYDKLRDLLYDGHTKQFILSTSQGMYSVSTAELKTKPFEIQPPVSVMGINTLEPFANGSFMVGSFSGLFLWHPSHAQIYNYAKGEIYKGNTSRRPIGDFKITGHITDVKGNQYMVDYDKGVLPLYHTKSFPAMPANVLQASKMSLWNLSLEIHTGRIFQGLIGIFYILIVPLSALVSVMVVLSGYLLWRKQYKVKNK